MMKTKIFQVMWVLLITNFCFGNNLQTLQDTINQLDSKGVKQGYWKKTDAKGNPIYEAYFKNGMPFGEVKRYYPLSNKVKAILLYETEIKEVYARMFSEMGNLMAEGYYVDKVKDGKWKYYAEDTVLLYEESYKMGKKDNFSKKFYHNGEYSEVTQWKEGVKDGIWKQYFENGKIKLEAGHKNGKRTGDFILYFISGKIDIKGQYIDDMMHGKWIFYNERGDMVKEIEYNYGKALNKEALEKEETERLNKIEEMKGKIPEPEDALYGN